MEGCGVYNEMHKWPILSLKKDKLINKRKSEQLSWGISFRR